MPSPIIEVVTSDDQTNTTRSNILAAPSRLNSIPYDGTLTLEVSATVSKKNNFVAITIQTPDGEVPVLEELVPFNGYDDGNHVLHNDTEYVFTFDAPQGGHFNIDMDVTGNSTWIVRATLT